MVEPDRRLSTVGWREINIELHRTKLHKFVYSKCNKTEDIEPSPLRW